MMSKNSIPPIKFRTFLEHWSYTRLKEVKDVRDGTHSSPKYIDTGYPLVTSKNLTDSGLNLNDVSLISESDYNEINKRSKVEVGDILLGLIGTIGKPVLVETDGFAIKNVGLIKNGGQIQNQFLLQYLKTNLFNKYIQIEMAGNTQKFLGLETLRNTKVPVPSSEEQSAIGSFFRTLDVLLGSYKDNLANYQSLKATMLSKMFPKAGQTVPEIRLDGFEGEWEEKYIGELADIVRGASPRPIQDPKWFDPNSEIGWLRISDVTSQNGRIHSLEQKISKVGQEKTRVLTEPHLLLSIAATVGKPVVNYVKTGVHDGFLIFMNPKFDREFMFQWLEMYREKWNRYGQPGSQVNLNSDIVKNQKILVPCMEEQQSIGAYFSNLDNLINSHQEKISQLETLKKKLLQDMFI
jgi:restriction modification system DNA specificity domain protein